MINLKKVGLTALAGSLAAVTANAGEISVSGVANVTYVTKSGNNANSIGTDKDVKFSGSGELDNGWTVFSYYNDWCLCSIIISYSNRYGIYGFYRIWFRRGTNVAGAYDETYPRAYEENSDAGGQSAANYVGNWADDQAIVYQWPGMDLAGVSLSGGFEYSLQADGSATPNDGNAVANQDTWGSGYGIGLTADTNMGIVAGIYYAERENKNHSAANDVTDEWNGSYFVNYSAGPVSIGYQEAYVDSGLTSATNATNAAKTVGTSSGQFEAQNMSIAFNVNDDLSISYAEAEETYDSRDMLTSTTETADVTQQSESLQIAYSMGSMSIKAYTTEITNPNYDEDADNLKKNEIAIGLAF